VPVDDATALSDFTHIEPLPWSDFFIARSRALAAHGRGERSETNWQVIRALRDQAAQVGLTTAIPALDEALLGC
jgi:hypothetical protein